MRDFDAAQEQRFFDIFKKYYDLEKDAGKQHNPENYSLDRMYPLAELVGNPEKRFKIIHVAGTKGKGPSITTATAIVEAVNEEKFQEFLLDFKNSSYSTVDNPCLLYSFPLNVM